MLTYWEVNGDRREIDYCNISQCVSETLALIPPTVCVSVCVGSIAQTSVNELLLGVYKVPIPVESTSHILGAKGPCSTQS